MNLNHKYNPVPSKESHEGKSIKPFIPGGGFIASVKQTPILWAVGFSFLFILIGTSVWATYNSIPYTTTSNSLNDDNVNILEDEQQTIEKPNIIYILADDLGWNSMGYEDFDLSFVTPKLTSMAQSGLILSSFYAQEVCTPARASLLTGRYPLNIGMQYSMVQTAIPWGMDLSETTLPEVLRNDSYQTHMLGKWHLGHFSPRYLPTARGFQTYTGFVNGENYYWSKRNPDHTTFHDLMYSDENCYVPYEDEDMHDYSTFFYRDKAIDVIQKHNTSKGSLFLYLAFQAVHDPFVDISVHENGVPKEYLQEDMYNNIIQNVHGRKRRQYAMSLNLMDEAVDSIVTALDEKGILENTFIIFSSDNGGCYGAGGKNGPLRGTKGSLFEGGTKVDAFIWSPKLPEELQGSSYQNLFHISDMFPTILALTGTDFQSDSSHPLDGVNHLPAILGETDESPREHMLYNFYYNVDKYQFNMWVNGSFAVRSLRYKLMHTFNSSIYAQWYQPERLNSDDDAITTESRCASSTNNDGEFMYWLFDLENDPYETNNLYESSEQEHTEAKEELYEKLEGYAASAYEVTFSYDANRASFEVWKQHNNYMVPYVRTKDLESRGGKYPKDCYASDDTIDNNEITITQHHEGPSNFENTQPQN